MKKPQWFTLIAGVCLVAVLYFFGRIIPEKKPASLKTESITQDAVSTDSVLTKAKKQLSPEQIASLSALEHSVVRGDVRKQQLTLFHHLALFWRDTARVLEPYLWYNAAAARLENSEKTLTFAAHQFLLNLREENDPAFRKWEALQASDLFERSLKINPENDSSVVGLSACYIFGNIGNGPMESIQKLLTVINKDSTNVFALEVLGHASMISGQYDKAITRFESLLRHSENKTDIQLEACLMLAEAYERKDEKQPAIKWYKKSLGLIKSPDVKSAVQQRIDDLSDGKMN